MKNKDIFKLDIPAIIQEADTFYCDNYLDKRELEMIYADLWAIQIRDSKAIKQNVLYKPTDIPTLLMPTKLYAQLSNQLHDYMFNMIQDSRLDEFTAYGPLVDVYQCLAIGWSSVERKDPYYMKVLSL